MPQNKFALARYQLIDHLLQKMDYVKTSLIAEYCFERTGYKVSTRTIQMDIESMRYDPFLGIYAPIDYCKRHKAYYYTDSAFHLHLLQAIPEDVLQIEEIIQKYKCKIQSDDYQTLMNLLYKVSSVLS